jgi:hypothetical protein
MRILNDGTVLQSTLSSAPATTAGKNYRMDFAIKKGIVKAAYYPEDKDNISKQVVEYDVIVTDERADGSASTTTYLRCQTLDRFGTPNNFEHFTLQANKTKDKARYKKGAQVLVMAVSGNASAGRAIIVGGYSYPYTTKPKKEDGQFYEWQFNGINIKVNKDGEYSLTFNTPIDVDGKSKDEGKDKEQRAGGTKLEILKDGKLKISDNQGQFWEIDRANQKSTWGNSQESIVLDKKNKKIDVVSTGTASETIAKSKSITVKEKDHTIETKSGSISEKSGKDIQRDAKANITEKAGGNWTFEAGGNATIKAGGNLMMTAGGNAQLKGTVNLIGDGSVLAAGVGISQCLGIGNLGAPVMSTIITGSATVLIGA